jgi:hypothetical protein
VPRLRLFDVLQDHYFWAFDASGAGGIPIFNPLFGFSKISAPEIGVEIEQFKDGTFLYNRSVAKGGTVSPVLFERGASMFDADFYTWIIHTLHGNKDFEGGGTLGKVVANLLGGSTVTPNPRRNLLIVQFTTYNLAAVSNNINNPVLAGAVAAGMAAVGALGVAAAGGGAVGIAAGAASVAGSVSGSLEVASVGLGPFSFATRIPARSWLLHNCLPVRYRSGNDFDATSGAVSLMELEVQPEYIEEFSLGIKP